MQIGKRTPRIIFMLGGPGAGKGTQSSFIQSTFGFKHLSAGDLLRAERSSPGSEYGQLIDKHIVQGTIVPAIITVKLLQKAIIKEETSNKFLIDGFPRNMQNLKGWQEVIGDSFRVDLVLHLHCTQKILEERLLKRAESSGRSDDNINSIRKRFVTYTSETLEVINFFKKNNKIKQIDAGDPRNVVSQKIRQILLSLEKQPHL